MLHQQNRSNEQSMLLRNGNENQTTCHGLIRRLLQCWRNEVIAPKFRTLRKVIQAWQTGFMISLFF